MENENIHLTKQEAIQLVSKLDEIVVSLDKIKSHFAQNTNHHDHDSALSDYIINSNVNQSLANIRKILSSKINTNVGDDNMDEIERACENNVYWSPKETLIKSDLDAENWYENQVPILKSCIINDFDYIFNLLKNKNQNMYAFALVLDDDCLTAYSVTSTFESLKKLHKNKEWDANEWCFGPENDNVKNGVNYFIDILLNYYEEKIVPQFKKGFDYEPIKQKHLQLFTNAMQLAKLDLIEKYGDQVKQMVFYLTITGEPIVEKNSAIAINETGNLKMKELLDSLYI